MRFALTLSLAVACGGTINLEDIRTPEDIAALCAEREPEVATVRVAFDAVPPGCAWGQDGNLDPAQGVVTARSEQYQDLELPEDGVVCGLGFQFQVDPNVVPTMEYDDNMFFLYNGVILAASYGPMVDPLPRERGLPVWSWDALAGTPFSFDNNIPSYCLGQEDGRSDCEIPPPETRGPLVMSFDDDLVDELAFRAVQLGTERFGFVTIGDNDADLDCRHDAFDFDVEIPYIPL